MVTISGGFSTKAFVSNKKNYGVGAPAQFNEIHALIRIPLGNILSDIASGQITNDKKHYITTTVDGHHVKIDKWAMDTIYRCLIRDFHNGSPTVHLKQHVYSGSKQWLRGAIEFKHH